MCQKCESPAAAKTVWADTTSICILILRTLVYQKPALNQGGLQNTSTCLAAMLLWYLLFNEVERLLNVFVRAKTNNITLSFY